MAANLTDNIGLGDIQSDSQFICKMPLGTIGPKAFNNASTLTSIEIYDAQQIQANTLSGCTNLRRLILPRIRSYSSNVFGTTSKLGLEYLQILEDTQNIGTMLSSISSCIDLNLPTTLTSLEPSALYGVACDKIKLSQTAILCADSLMNASVNDLYFNPAKSSKQLNLGSCENINNVFCIKNSTPYTLDTQLSGCKANQIVFQSRGTNINGIQQSAFYNCENISYIDLHSSSLLTLPTHAFLNCGSLLSVFLPTSLTSIQTNAFEGCNGLRNYKLNIDGVKCINGYIGYNAYFSSVPNTLTSVGDSAFKDAKFDSSSISLSIDVLPSNLFMMNNLLSKSNVTSITLNHGFSSYIPYQCFKNQTQLTSINNTDAVTYIESNAFYNDSSLQYINISSATSIAESAFEGCTSLTAIDMRNVKKIEKYAFKGCRNLTKDHINSDDTGGVNTIQLFVNNAQDIGDEAFKNSGLQHISIGSKFISDDSSIGSSIFNSCTNLTHISVDLTYEDFAKKLGISDDDIERVVLNRSDTTIVANARNQLYKKLFGTDFISQQNFTIQCKDISLSKTGEGNDLLCLKYEDPSTKVVLSCVDATASDYITFYLNPKLLAATHEVRANAFSQALTSVTSSLTSITMPEVTQCAPGILSGSSYLEYAVANRLTLIEDHMLANDVALTSVEARNALSIGNYALCGCTSLTNTDGLVSLTSIGEYGFAYCSSLTDIKTLETSLKHAKTHSFKSCTSLTSFSSVTLTSIGQGAFEDCTSLTSFYAPLLSVNSQVFNGCSNLKTINLVDSKLTSIPSNAFGNTQSLTSIQFPPTITSLGSSSLKCSQSNMLNVTLNGKTRNAANISTLLKSNNECGSPTGTLFFTDDSIYPSFITLASNNIIKVASEKIKVDRSGQLIEIDISLKSIDNYMLSNLTGIKTTALNRSLCQSIYLPTAWSLLWSDLQSKIEDNAFNNINSPNLIEIILVGKKISDVDASSVREFYRLKTGSNDRITIRFSNAIFDGKNIIYASDPFTFEYADEKYIITGVKDEIMSTTESLSNGHIDMIPERYSAISSYAFADTKILSSIGYFNNITCIMPYAFTYNTSISSIYVAHNVSSSMDIQNNAFLNSSIKYAKLDNKLSNSSTTGLSGYGLNNAIKFNTLEYENGVTKIAPSAMIDYICDLSCIILPTTLRSIGDYAFAKTIDRFPCIKNVNFQDMSSLTSIGKYSFYNSIRSMPDNTLKFNKKLKKIDDAAFAYRWESYIDEISGLSSQYDSITIATENVQTIGMSAFMFNKLKNVEFGNKIQTISSYAFAYPKYKFDVNIPASIRHIGENAFYKNIILNPKNIKKNVIYVQCDISSFPSIFDITIDEMDYADNKAGFTNATVISATHSANRYNAFAYIHNNKMMFCPSNLSIDLLNQAIISCETTSTSAYLQPYVEKIGPSAFYGCVNLQSLSVHQNVLSGKAIDICEYAFYNCSSLTHIKNIDDPTNHVIHLSNVNDYAFYGCEQLSNVKLLSTTNYIGDYAFAKCKSLTSMNENDTLSAIQFWTLSGIGEYAFASCDSLTSFYIPQSISAMGYHMFDSCPSLSNIYINIDSNRFLEIVGEHDIGHAVSSMFNGINDDGSCYINFLDIIYMNNGIVKIDNEYVNTYDNDGKTYISSLNYEKLYRDNKTYLNLSSIDGIDQFVFSNCLQLASISFLDNDIEHLDFIGDYAFNGCTNLISFNNGKFNGTHIGMYAFSNCNDLLTFEIDYRNISANIQFDQGAFFGTSLNNIYITNVPSVTNEVLDKIKESFGFIHRDNPNPLQLPEYCVIHLLDSANNEIGRYDFMFNNLLGSTIDINRNALVFSDKSTDSIRPLAIVRQVDDTYLPALVTNTFHMNIIGRWK